MRFSDLSLIDPLLRAVTDQGYTSPTPIQREAIPHVLAGRDLLGCAQTGTGKTAAFALPLLQRLNETRAAATREAAGRGESRASRARGRPVRCLVLTPTRELATQIGESFETYGRDLPIRATVIFGGVGQTPQVKALERGVDVVIATPGRLLDLIGQGHIDFRALEAFVLDEADRMLDMGFIHDVRRIIDVLPRRRQTLLFSATMPSEIAELAEKILERPAKVAVTPVSSTAERIEQSVYFVDKADKRALLEHVLQDRRITRALVFTRTKHGADRVAQHLLRTRVRTAAIHGNKSQGARERALGDFKAGDLRVLVATDIAARGIDVEDISHVINFDLPNIPESYVHRIGRTARAGKDGIAISFCDAEERAFLKDIQKLIKQSVSEVQDHPYRSYARERTAPPQDRGSFADRRETPHATDRASQGDRAHRAPHPRTSERDRRDRGVRPHERASSERPAPRGAARGSASPSASRPAAARVMFSGSPRRFGGRR